MSAHVQPDQIIMSQGEVRPGVLSGPFFLMRRQPPTADHCPECAAPGIDVTPFGSQVSEYLHNPKATRLLRCGVIGWRAR